jgi:hypothetical protein
VDNQLVPGARIVLTVAKGALLAVAGFGAVDFGRISRRLGPLEKFIGGGLGRAIHTQVAQGARVESQGDYQAILVRGHRPNHMLHLVLSIVTLALWLFVWLGVIAFGGEKRMSASVDEWGNTNLQNL